jgi:hypothetical protein
VNFAVVFVTLMWIQRAGCTVYCHSYVNVSLIFIWLNLPTQHRLCHASVSIMLYVMLRYFPYQIKVQQLKTVRFFQLAACWWDFCLHVLMWVKMVPRTHLLTFDSHWWSYMRNNTYMNTELCTVISNKFNSVLYELDVTCSNRKLDEKGL